jgi:predicted metalloprotease with PDZ domain
MPRSIPGTYGITPYDHFIHELYAIDRQKLKHLMIKDENDAPRWNIVDSGKMISSIEYIVDLDKMERTFAPADASIIRGDFAGILNYSVFGWVEGQENDSIQCVIETFSTWPVFSTLQPDTMMLKGRSVFNVNNYYTLADAQIFMGPGFHVKKYMGIVPLFIASYVEHGIEYLDDYGKQGMISLGILKAYFKELHFYIIPS